jgi:hypothetical protein
LRPDIRIKYRMLKEKNRALLKGGLNEKQPAELAVDGGLAADRERKRRQAAAERPIPGKKQKPAVGGRGAHSGGRGAPAILLTC